jgi:hypothetical protein
VKPIRALAIIAALFLAGPSLRAQETGNKPAAETASETPVRVQIVLSEFDGTRKIGSLPYSLNILGTGPRDRQYAHLRYGVRVPIVVGNGKGDSVTYQNVGTDIDCVAVQRDDGAYRLDLTIDRSSVSNGKDADWKPGDSSPGPQPLIRSFRDDFAVVLKNGQTVEGTSAVDPVTGHVLKIDVTLTVLK